MKLFLSYPSEKLYIAKEIHAFFKSASIECWFDKEDLVGATKWDRRRKKALKDADLTVILCSHETISKRGVYQREINEAIEKEKDYPIDQTGILPIKLEDVALPPELSDLQWIEYFKPDWRKKIAVAILDRLPETEKQKLTTLIAIKNGTARDDLEEVFQIDKHPAELDFRWFRYKIPGDYWRYVNSNIESIATGYLYEFKKYLNEDCNGREFYELGVTESFRSNELISISFGHFRYYGGAYPSHGVTTLNFWGNEIGKVAIDELFEYNDDTLNYIKQYILNDFVPENDDEPSPKDAIKNIGNYGWPSIAQYTFNSRFLILHFSEFAGLPHVMGYSQVLIPWKKMLPHMGINFKSKIENLGSSS